MYKTKRRHSILNSFLSIFVSVCLVTANISVTALADEASNEEQSEESVISEEKSDEENPDNGDGGESESGENDGDVVNSGEVEQQEDTTDETSSEASSEPATSETSSESEVENELLAKFVSLVNELPEVTSDEYSSMSTDEKNELYSKTNDAWDIYYELEEQELSDYEQTVFSEASEKLGKLAELFSGDISMTAGLAMNSDGTTTVIPESTGGTTNGTTQGSIPEHNHKLCNGKDYYGHDGSSCNEHETKKWKEWSILNGLPSEAGDYYLITNVTLSSDWEVPSGGVSICLNGFNITGEGCIYIGDGHTLNLTDCRGTGKDGTVDNEGYYGTIDNSGTFYMYGGIVSGTTGKDGGVFNEETFIMNGGSVIGEVYNVGGYFTMNGGTTDGVYNAYGTFTMNGGNSIGCVYNTVADFIMNGGEITDNIARVRGGGVYNDEDGIFIMNGGSITNNSAEVGGGVYNDGIFTMNGGSITGNTAKVSGGGIYNNNEGIINIKGNVVIKDNTLLEEKTVNNVYLSEHSELYVDGILGDTSSIGITSMESPTDNSSVTIAVSGADYAITESDASKFTSDNNNYSIKYNSEKNSVLLTVSSQSDTPTEDSHVHPICGASCSLTSDKHEDITWTAWDSTDSLPNDDDPNAYYYLTDDVVLASMQTIDKGMNLCLNGHTISISETAESSNGVVYINNGVTVKVTDCKGKGGFYNLNKVARRCIYIDGGIFYLYDGYISGWQDSYGGVGVYNYCGTFYMYGGKIEDNSISSSDSNKGGGGAGVLNVRVNDNGGIFYIYGGEIIGNTDNGIDGGGGVNNQGKLYIYGGKIKDNRANVGPGLYNAKYGVVYFAGTIEISDNKLLNTEKQVNLYFARNGYIKITHKLVGNDDMIVIPISSENLPITIRYNEEVSYEINVDNIENVQNIKVIDDAFVIKYDKENSQLIIKPVDISNNDDGSDSESDDEDDNGGDSESTDSDDNDDGSGDGGSGKRNADNTTKKTDDIITVYSDRITNIENILIDVFGDIKNIRYSKDYIGSVFVSGLTPTGKIRSGLVLVNGTFVIGILYDDGTFISGTIDDNNMFTSNSIDADNQRIVCYINEYGYPFGVTPATIPQPQDQTQTNDDTKINNVEAIITAQDRIPDIVDIVIEVLEDIGNVSNSEDYIGSVFVSGIKPDGKIKSGLILVDGTFVPGIMYYDKTFVSGTTDDNNMFTSNSIFDNNQKLVCYIDEKGYPLASAPVTTTQPQTTTPTKDNEPKTGDEMPPLATLGMIAGMAYLLEYFAEKKGLCLGMTKAQKDKLISFLVSKAKGKNKFIRMSMLSVIFLILVFYHSIGKIVEVDGLGMECE